MLHTQAFRIGNRPAATFMRWFSKKSAPSSKLQDSYLSATSASYMENLEQQVKEDPSSVDKTWSNFFSQMDKGNSPSDISQAYSSWKDGSEVSLSSDASHQTIKESMKLLMLIRAYQVTGHAVADIDPLKMMDRVRPDSLNPSNYGFTEQDMDREFFVGTWKSTGFLAEDVPMRTLRDIISRLEETYCGTIGYEYMHIPDMEKCNWIRARVETLEKKKYSKKRKLHLLDRIAWSEMFESFLANKYTAAKRFGLEGAETLIPGMKALIDRSAELGVTDVIIGMPHRGRLNVLANVLRKPLPEVFCEFKGNKPDEAKPEGIQNENEAYTGSGDVKYHLGTSYDRPTVSGKNVHLTLLANPSHLEAVNPVVLGKTRAKQYLRGDTEHEKVLPLLLHGDGAFAGQGVVFETFDMSHLADYKVGGTIHLVVNNQVAFTTDPKYSRSSMYCTEVGKTTDAPIFHVNGDDLDAVVHVMELAAEYRQKFKSDVVIDLVCYRKYGHNEIDEPMFTQPQMYKVIKKHPNPHQVYASKLIDSGIATPKEVKDIQTKCWNIMEEEFERAKDYVPKAKDWLSSHWEGFKSPAQVARIRHTGVSTDVLKEVGTAIHTLPEDFTPHKAVKRVYNNRRKMMETGEGVDWGTAEALAFGSLLMEGNHVRVSGQDVERGTFTHRHAVVHDQNSGRKYCPLDNIWIGQHHAQFSISNSNLSEYAVLGYELGYSMEDPNSLVIWEAQFGDFANTAQVIFDQFLSSGEAKWLRQSGLTVLLPHGYDGQGPEHSSARLERFLQMSDEDPYSIPNMDMSKWLHGEHMGNFGQLINWQVVNCTTPANYFHLLRRQLHRQYRKPLIVMSPKSLLRHPKCKSALWEFDDQVVEHEHDHDISRWIQFRRLIMDDGVSDRSHDPKPIEEVKRLILCSGKVFYDLHEKREELKLEKDVAICRIEQLTPFPFDLLMREIKRYPNAEIMWVQEEPMNMGAYTHIVPRVQTCLGAVGKEIPPFIKYSGREVSASTSTGFAAVHASEQAILVDGAFAEI